jgi:hypothetical protein
MKISSEQLMTNVAKFGSVCEARDAKIGILRGTSNNPISSATEVKLVLATIRPRCFGRVCDTLNRCEPKLTIALESQLHIRQT